MDRRNALRRLGTMVAAVAVAPAALETAGEAIAAPAVFLEPANPDLILRAPLFTFDADGSAVFSGLLPVTIGEGNSGGPGWRALRVDQ